VREWPRFGIFTISVTAGLRLCRLDRTGADEELGADLEIRESVAPEPSDLGLLGGQVAAGLDAGFADGLARGEELSAGPVGERFDAHHRQVRAGELDAEAGTAEALDVLGFAILVGLGVAGGDGGCNAPAEELALSRMTMGFRDSSPRLQRRRSMLESQLGKE
jgi:hypothetical protein